MHRLHAKGVGKKAGMRGGRDRYPGPVSKLSSVVLRLANNFVGAASWMRTAESLGLSHPRERRATALTRTR
jgi:hypothetical protein